MGNGRVLQNQVNDGAGKVRHRKTVGRKGTPFRHIIEETRIGAHVQSLHATKGVRWRRMPKDAQERVRRMEGTLKERGKTLTRIGSFLRRLGFWK